MSLKAHLIEFRNRLIVAFCAIVAGSIGGWYLYNPVIEDLMLPLTNYAATTDQIVTPAFSSVTAAFDFKIRIAFYIGLFLATPVWLYQILAYITPGLKKREKWYLYGFLGAGVPLFFAGGWVGYLVLPQLVRFFIGFTPEQIANIPDAQMYLAMAAQTVVAMAVSFLVPVVLVAANFLGVLRARTMITGWRWMVVISFTFAAIATPTPDVVLMFFVASPMLVLYAVAVLISYFHDRAVLRRLERDFGDDAKMMM